MSPGDQNGLAGIPGSEFTVFNSATGQREIMGIYFATFMGFTGVDGQKLDNNDVKMQVYSYIVMHARLQV